MNESFAAPNREAIKQTLNDCSSYLLWNLKFKKVDLHASDVINVS